MENEYIVRFLMLPSDDPREMPTVIEALDEYTEEAWSGYPDWWMEKVRDNPKAREMVVRIPQNAVINLFSVPSVLARAISPDR